MRWLTNAQKSRKDEFVQKLSAGHDYSVITGRPHSSEYSIEELEAMGYIGFYRVGECHCILCRERRVEIRKDPLKAWKQDV